ncbi:MAG: lipopolysaccharide biosynthesis protein [Acidobacteriota bacterium]
MTRPSSVVSSAASLLTSRAAVALIAIAFLGVTTRLLSIEELAVFALYNSFCGLITVVSSLGLLAAGVKLLPGMQAAQRRAEAAGFIGLALIVYALIAVAWTGLLIVVSGELSMLILKSPRFAGDIKLAALASLGFGLYEAGQLLLNGLQRYGTLSRNNVLTAFTQRIASLALFFLVGFRGYLVGFGLGSLVGAVYGLAVVSRAARGISQRAIGPGWVRRQLGFAAPFYADGYLRYLSMQLDQLLVGIFLPPAALSIYFIGKRFLHYCQMLVRSLIDPLATRVAELRERAPAEVGPMVRRSLRYFVLSFVPLSLLLAASSPFLLWMIAGEKYMEGTLALALLFLSVPFYAVFSHLAAFVFILGDPKDRLLANAVSAVAQTAAMVVLMPLLAIEGLAIARSVGFGIAILGARGLLRKHLRDVARPGLLGLFFRCLGPSMVMGAILLIPYLMLDNVLWIPMALLPAVAVCLAGYLAFVLTREDRTVLSEMVPVSGRAWRTMQRIVRGG